jgi:hypothetical protein
LLSEFCVCLSHSFLLATISHSVFAAGVHSMSSVSSRDMGMVQCCSLRLRHLARLDRHDWCQPGDTGSHRQVSYKKWCDMRDTSIGYTRRRIQSPEARAVHYPTFFDPGTSFVHPRSQLVRRRINAYVPTAPEPCIGLPSGVSSCQETQRQQRFKALEDRVSVVSCMSLRDQSITSPIFLNLCKRWLPSFIHSVWPLSFASLFWLGKARQDRGGV